MTSVSAPTLGSCARCEDSGRTRLFGVEVACPCDPFRSEAETALSDPHHYRQRTHTIGEQR